MKSLKTLHFIIYLTLSLTMISCTAPESSLRSPEPSELITDERYKFQVAAIDQEREEEGLPTFTELINEDRVTKTPNGTEPIVVEIPRDRQTMDEARENAELGFFEPVHDKVQIEEYFVIEDDEDSIEIEETNDTSNDDSPVIEGDLDSIQILSPTINGDQDDQTETSNAVRNNNARIQEILKEREERRALLREGTTEILVDNLTQPSPSSPEAEDLPPTSETNNQPPSSSPDTSTYTPPSSLSDLDSNTTEPIREENPSLVYTSIRPQARKEINGDTNLSIDEDPFEAANNNTAISTSIRPQARPANLDTSPRENTTNVSNYKAQWDVNVNGQAYTRHTLRALDSYGQELLSATNINDAGYCEGLNSLSRDQKKQFWLMVLSGMAKWESGFDTDAKYLESSGRYSRGLLQLDYQHRRHYRCDLSSQYDLHDAQKNLECGVKMIQKLVIQDRIVRGGQTGAWRGAARFWSVLRPSVWSGQKRRNVLTIPAEARNLSFCR